MGRAAPFILRENPAERDLIEMHWKLSRFTAEEVGFSQGVQQSENGWNIPFTSVPFFLEFVWRRNLECGNTAWEGGIS